MTAAKKSTHVPLIAAGALAAATLFTAAAVLKKWKQKKARQSLEEDAAQGKTVAVPGHCPYGRFSIMPLVEAIQFITGYRKYVERGTATYGCPIFRGHPGVETVLVTDHASVKAAFAMGPDQLDRDGTVAFGPIKVQYEDMLRGCIPALMSDQKRHKNRRQLIVDVLAVPSTQERFQQAVRDSLKNSWPIFRQDIDKTEELVHACGHAASTFVMHWLYDLEGADGAMMEKWLDQAMGLRSDRLVANSLGNLAKPKPTQELKDWSESEMQRIQNSEPFIKHYRDIGAKLGFPPEETAAHLLWASHFNASGGIHGTLLPTIAMLTNQTEMEQRLQEEQKDFWNILQSKSNGDGDEGSNVDMAKELDQLPYLNAFVNESFRFFGRPKHYYRKAVQDVVLPTSDGKRVQIPQGSVLGLVSFTARQDPTLFPGPEKFSPQRYLDNPELEYDLFNMGPPSDTPGGIYNCAGAEGRWAIRAFKVNFAAFLQKKRGISYTLDPSPIIDIDAKVGISEKQTIMLNLKK